MSIHPRQNVVVRNLNISDNETEMVNFIWGNNEYQPKPLFGIRTTNGIEGENNALFHNDFCYQTVPQAMITFIARCSEIKGKMDTMCNKLLETKATVCEKAHSIIEVEHEQAGKYTVPKCNSDIDVYNVIHSGRSNLVDLNSKLCSGCIVWNQLLLPCRHIIAVLNSIQHYGLYSLFLSDS
jgi:hypothetical protein